MSTRFFSDEEIKRLRSWPEELGRNELIRYFTLGSDDREWLATAARGVGNRMSLALQLCALPWLGFVPDDVAGAPISELVGYGGREQTRTEHLGLVAARLGWRTADAAEWKDLEEFLLARAVEHDAPSVLFRLACGEPYSRGYYKPLLTIPPAEEDAQDVGTSTRTLGAQ